MFFPVLRCELENTARTRWFANVRRLYAGLVLFFFAWYVVDLFVFRAGAPQWIQFSNFLWLHPEYMNYLMSVHALAVFVLTPILAVAGVIQARNRQTLDLLLTTQQRSLEIVSSYWLGAVIKVLLVTSPGLPLLLWMGAVWGTPWWLILLRLACISLLAFPIAAWSVMMTLRLSRIAPAMIVAYAGTFAVWPALFLCFTDSQLGALSNARPDAEWGRFVLFLAKPTALFLLLTSLCLRHWLEGSRGGDRRAPIVPMRPPLAEEPIFWKQYHLHDFSLIGGLRRWPTWLRIIGFVIVSCLACSVPVSVGDGTPQTEMVIILAAFPLGALILAASTASSERESATWDPLRVTLIGAEEYFGQTLSAVLLRMRTYWLATIPAVVILTCKGREIGLVTPIVWLIAGGLMRPAAVIGLCFSVKADSASKSILQGLMLFLSFVVGSGFLLFAALMTILAVLHDLNLVYAHMVISGHRPIALATALHLLCTWLLLRELFDWHTRRQRAAAVAYLAQSEHFQPQTI